MSNGTDFDGNIVGFRHNVICIQLSDPDDPSNKVFSKVINLAKKQQFTATSDASSMLLYLMMQDRGDEIAFSELLQYITDQYTLDPTSAKAALNGFLNELDSYKLLWCKKDTSGGVTPDPLALFSGVRTPKLTWPTEATYLTQGQNISFFGTDTIFTSNYKRIIYRY